VTKLLCLLASGAASIAMSSGAAGSIWVEGPDDAGRLPAAAQDTVGAGSLDEIHGSLDLPGFLDDAIDVDLFRIFVADAAAFSASTREIPGITVSDPQLFLFDSAGLGVYMNDDDDSGLNGSQSRLPAGHMLGPVAPGFYFLAIGWFNNEPFSADGQIYSDAVGTHGSDGPGGLAALSSWNDDVLAGVDPPTDYEIVLTGAMNATNLAAVPEASMIVTGAIIALCAEVGAVLTRGWSPRMSIEPPKPIWSRARS
jgi:hypothetical protein